MSRLFASFIAPRQDFPDRRAAGVLAHFFDPLQRPPCDRPLGVRIIGDQPGDGLAVSRDHHSLAALDLVEQFGELGLRNRGLNFFNGTLTGQFDR